MGDPFLAPYKPTTLQLMYHIVSFDRKLICNQIHEEPDAWTAWVLTLCGLGIESLICFGFCLMEASCYCLEWDCILKLGTTTLRTRTGNHEAPLPSWLAFRGFCTSLLTYFLVFLDDDKKCLAHKLAKKEIHIPPDLIIIENTSP